MLSAWAARNFVYSINQSVQSINQITKRGPQKHSRRRWLKTLVEQNAHRYTLCGWRDRTFGEGAPWYCDEWNRAEGEPVADVDTPRSMSRARSRPSSKPDKVARGLDKRRCDGATRSNPSQVGFPLPSQSPCWVSYRSWGQWDYRTDEVADGSTCDWTTWTCQRS